MEFNIEYFNTQRILITGGGGYLGSKLAEKLANSKAIIFLLDIRFNDFSKWLIEKHTNILCLHADLTDMLSVSAACQTANPTIIFHFGALLDRTRDFLLYEKLYAVNVKGTLNLLEVLKQYNYTHFMYASSSEVYGAKNTPPFNEGQIPSPVSPYSLTKFMAEQIISTFSDTYKKPYSILRIFNFYGPNMPENFFLSQLEAALNKNLVFKMTKGEQIRDYLNIEDLIKFISCLCTKENLNTCVLNICSGKGRKLIDIAYEIAKNLGKENLIDAGTIPYRENEIWEMVGDNTKLLKLLKIIDSNLS